MQPTDTHSMTTERLAEIEARLDAAEGIPVNATVRAALMEARVIMTAYTELRGTGKRQRFPKQRPETRGRWADRRAAIAFYRLTHSGTETAAFFGISRERVRQIVEAESVLVRPLDDDRGSGR